jgi:alkylation response protein AidB-like acyl-CoA dehydrogenase
MGIIESIVGYRTRPAAPTTDWVTLATRVGAQLSAPCPPGERPDHDLGEAISLLKTAGLVTVLAPTRQGGGGQQWTIAYQILREIAAADEHLAHLLAQHFLWSWLAQRAATPEQADSIHATATRNRWFFAGPLATDAHELTVRDDSQHLVFNGRQKFAAGSGNSDVTVLNGQLHGMSVRPLAIVPTRHPGLTFHTDADDHDEPHATTTEQRTIRNNGMCVAEVRVASHDILGLPITTPPAFEDDPLSVRLAQLLLTNVAIGVIRGSVRAGLHQRPARPGQQQEYRTLVARTETLVDQMAARALEAVAPSAPAPRHAEPIVRQRAATTGDPAERHLRAAQP